MRLRWWLVIVVLLSLGLTTTAVAQSTLYFDHGAGTTSLAKDLAIVSASAAEVRNSPSANAPVIAQAVYGTELRVVGRQAGWLKVELPDQRNGWVNAGQVVTAAR